MRKDVAADNYVPSDFEGRKWYSKFFEACNCSDLGNASQPLGMEPDPKDPITQIPGMEFVNGVQGRWSLALQQRIKYRSRDDARDLKVKEKNVSQLKCSECKQQMFDFADPKNDDFIRKSYVAVPGCRPESETSGKAVAAGRRDSRCCVSGVEVSAGKGKDEVTVEINPANSKAGTSLIDYGAATTCHNSKSDTNQNKSNVTRH